MEMLLEVLKNALELSGSAVGVWAVTALVKKANAIPVSEGQAARIRSVSGLLSALSAAGVMFANGSLDQPTTTAAIQAVLTFGVVWLGSHGVHHGLKPKQ